MENNTEEKIGFLRNINDTTLYWKFTLVGRKIVIGRVIHFLWTAEGIPITLMIKQDDKKNPIEILWTNILTIEQTKD